VLLLRSRVINPYHSYNRWTQNMTHNHRINEEIYRHLKQNKIVPTDMLVQQVDILRKANAPIRHLAEFISREVGECCSWPTLSNIASGHHSIAVVLFANTMLLFMRR
jgi:hypothetical protein